MLLNKWTLYENYQAQDQKVDFKDTIQKVCEITSLEELAYIVRKTMYGHLRRVFSDPIESKLKVYSRFNVENPASEEGTEVLMAGLSIFKDGIHPSWEDPSNSAAGELQFEASQELLPKLDELFQELLYIVIGQEQRGTQRINGIRAIDKLNPKQGTLVRFEVWVDFDPRSDDPILKQEKSDLDGILIRLQQQFGSTKLNVKIVPHSSTQQSK